MLRCVAHILTLELDQILLLFIGIGDVIVGLELLGSCYTTVQLCDWPLR